MPSLKEVNRLIAEVPDLERQVASAIAKFHAANASVGSACLGMERPSVSDPNFQAAAREQFEAGSPSFDRLVDRLDKAKLKYAEVRIAVSQGRLAGKIADVIKRDAESRIAEHQRRFDNWDGIQARSLQEILLEYQTSAMVLNISLQEMMEPLKFRNCLTGEAYSWGDAAQGGEQAILGTDEDGSVLFMMGQSSRVLTYKELMALIPEQGNTLDDLSDDQVAYLAPVFERLKAGMESNGGVASWHRYEERAVRAFAPEWAIRPSGLAIHLLNLLYNVTAKAAGRPTIEVKHGDLDMPYVSVMRINEELANEMEIEWYGPPLD